MCCYLRCILLKQFLLTPSSVRYLLFANEMQSLHDKAIFFPNEYLC